MAQYLFKISFFLLIGTIWPGNISAEVPRLTVTNHDLNIFQKLSNSYHAIKDRGTKREIRWKKYNLKPYKMLFQKRGSKDEQIVWWILGIGLLLLIFWGLVIISLVWLASFVNIWIVVLLSIIILGLALFGFLLVAISA